MLFQCQVNSNSCEVRNVDLQTIKPEDVAFEAPFTITATRNDYIHALVAYFDVFFNACHKPVVISTSPKYAVTHWKQTVFYLEDTIMICAGESLTGTISCRQNDKNKRDLDVTISYKFAGQQGSCNRIQHYRIR